MVPEKKAGKGEKLSEIGHGNIAPVATHGGVTVREVHRIASVSMAGVARLRFGDASPQAARAARVALVALALIGDRLAFGTPAVWLRSGCDLVVQEDQVAWQRRGGELEPLPVDLAAVMEVFERARQAAGDAGLFMAEDVVHLAPGKGLADALNHAYLAAAVEDAS